MDIRKAVVAGAGISGVNACRLLKKAGVPDVILYDGNAAIDREKLAEDLPDGVLIVTGEFPDELLAGTDDMVISPGISIHAPFVERFRDAGIPVISEIELAYRFSRGRLAGITGTNGKTTTTALTGKILKDYYGDAFVVGNIGIPYTSIAADTTDDSVTVAEISSFQLEAVDAFHPTVSAVLNVTPDHLDRHGTMECYADTKMQIAKNQTSDEICVLNYEDEITRAMAERIPAKPFFFSSKRLLDDGICLDGDTIVLRERGRSTEVCTVGELQLLGTHNYENVMAAVAVALGMGVFLASAAESIKQFAGVAHRIEFVAEVGGVRYYNDSKGTNPDAAIRGIKAMDRPTYLIGGGYDKGVSFDEWIRAFDGKVVRLVLIGQTARAIAAAAEKAGFTDYVFADTFEEACRYCSDHARAGEAVLLSPACASWGMFQNYEQRGDQFKEFVHRL